LDQKSPKVGYPEVVQAQRDRFEDIQPLRIDKDFVPSFPGAQAVVSRPPEKAGFQKRRRVPTVHLDQRAGAGEPVLVSCYITPHQNGRAFLVTYPYRSEGRSLPSSGLPS